MDVNWFVKRLDTCMKWNHIIFGGMNVNIVKWGTQKMRYVLNSHIHFKFPFVFCLKTIVDYCFVQILFSATLHYIYCCFFANPARFIPRYKTLRPRSYTQENCIKLVNELVKFDAQQVGRCSANEPESLRKEFRFILDSATNYEVLGYWQHFETLSIKRCRKPLKTLIKFPY